jgi:DNA primase
MNSTVEDIKARIDIIDLIAEHVELKRAGQNYKGLCPFHSEKTPSFTVSPSKQIFHCFGCNKGGDIFSFLMLSEGMTFQEAVSYLAQRAGIRLEIRSQKSEVRSGIKEILFAIYKESLIFFHNNLKFSKQTISYLNERGLNSETIEKFSLGYSKNTKYDGNDSLFNHLKSKDFTVEHIKASGLVNSNEHGIYDFFRDRLMFPIFDLQGRVVAFGGRIMSPLKNAPKYINSPDSIIFKKGDLTYGLNIAKNSIAQKGYAIITEGYMDVIMCHQSGITNAVAPLGTALTPGHLKKIKRFSDKVLLVFDGDAAGTAAAKRSLELIYAGGITAKILPMPSGEDPDSLLKKHGEGYFRRYMSTAMTPVEFMLRVSGKSKLDAVRHILNTISKCPDNLLRDETIRELAEKSKINEAALREEFIAIRQKALKPDTNKQKLSNPALNVSRDEKMLLSTVLYAPEKSHLIAAAINPETIENPAVRGILEKVRTIASDLDKEKRTFIENLLDICSIDEQKLITMLSINPEIDTELAGENIEGCLKALTLRDIEKQIKSATETGDIKLLNSLLIKKKNITEQFKGHICPK